MQSWNKLFEVLNKYPDVFKPSSISFNRYKYVYIVSASRTFSSNWDGVSQMVPFADLINHENVNSSYDCRDQKSGEYIQPNEEEKMLQEKEKKKQEDEEKKYFNDLKDDIIQLNE